MEQYDMDEEPTIKRKFNFSRASAETPLVYISAGPRKVIVDTDRMVTPPPPPTTKDEVNKWIRFMKSEGIKHILMLLTPEEVAFYDCDLNQMLDQHFEQVSWVPSLSTEALFSLRTACEKAKTSRSRIVVFCSTGQVRSANVASYWLTRALDMGISDAVSSVQQLGSSFDCVRRCSMQGVVTLLGGEYELAQSTPRLFSAFPYSSRRSEHSSATPRVLSRSINSARLVSEERLPLATESTKTLSDGIVEGRSPRDPKVGKRKKEKLVVLTTGGTIDKDYPRSSKGYAFEFGPRPAAQMILGVGESAWDTCFRIGWDVEFISVAKKDSQDLDASDRERILEQVLHGSSGSKRFLCTHGTDTMIDTGRFLLEHGGEIFRKGVAVVITGAMKPALFKDSDASLNIGTALGALATAPGGVYIAMNGKVWDCENVTRSESGEFITETPY